MKAPTNGFVADSIEVERKSIINSELWHACAGPLVSLPPVGSLVVYFPQGHSEQVAASMQKETDFIPNYTNLPPKLICVLLNVILHADSETDEVYAQMTLQPVTKFDKEALLASDMGLRQSRQPTEFFCKTLTASDTSTHGGFSVPRRAAEKIFPPLDYSMQPPAQELVATDLHDHTWTFKHVYRGQPKRHLLTTGWSVFVSTKRLFAGDSVLFIRDEKSQLLLGIRHSNRQQSALSSSVISSDSMHIGILAAAAHAAANKSPFTIFYNPRACPSEFVVPLAKYTKAMYSQVSLGMRFRMMFETEESGVRRYMGTVTGTSDLDPARWKNSQWRNLQVGWDESTAGERPSRVSIWEIEPVVAPFYLCPPPFFRPKFPKQLGMPDGESDIENAIRRAMPWLGDDFGMKHTQPSSIFPGLSLMQWMSMQQNNQFPTAQSGTFPSPVPFTSLHNNNLSNNDPSKSLSFQGPLNSAPSLQPTKAVSQNQVNQSPQPPATWPQQQQLMQIPTSQQLQQHQYQHHQQQELQLLKQQQQIHQLQAQEQHHQRQQQQLHQLQAQEQHHQRQQQQLLEQQICPPSLLNNGASASNQILNQNLQPVVNSQFQLLTGNSQSQLLTGNSQSQLLTGNSQSQQSSYSASKNLFPSVQQVSDFQKQMEQQSYLMTGHHQQMQAQPRQQLLQQSLTQSVQQPQLPEQVLSEQIQLQFLQKLQQQQQFASSASALLLPQPQQEQQVHLQNQQSTQFPLTQQQMRHQQHSTNSIPTEKLHNSNNFSTSGLMQSREIHANQPQGHFKQVTIRGHSGLTDGDAPSCSTSPSAHQVSSLNPTTISQQGTSTMGSLGYSLVEPASNGIEELQRKSDIRDKYELPSIKGPNQLKYKRTITDHMEASSSGTSLCVDSATVQQTLPLPSFCLDNDVQSHPRNNYPFDNFDGLMSSDTLKRGYDSQKDLQNLLSNYDATHPTDIETELSTAAVSSQSLGMPTVPFEAGCSNDVTINEAGILSTGLWANQTQRMRTYTKVQKRGSVGRCIDVTRYKGYDELRNDLARMFGIEGQLEDPQKTEWKLVYVDHENDILLVGDDPWDEFVSCVQSIKILSLAEVQQMSLDGNLGHIFSSDSNL